MRNKKKETENTAPKKTALPYEREIKLKKTTCTVFALIVFWFDMITMGLCVIRVWNDLLYICNHCQMLEFSLNRNARKEVVRVLHPFGFTYLAVFCNSSGSSQENHSFSDGHLAYTMPLGIVIFGYSRFTGSLKTSFSN